MVPNPKVITAFIIAMLIEAGIVGVIVGFTTWNWAKAEVIADLGLKHTAALKLKEDELNEINKAFDGMALVLHEQTGKAYTRDINDQRRIRQLGRKLAKTTAGLDRSRVTVLELGELFGLLDRSALYNDLPESDYPEGTPGAYKTTTDAELVGYARKVVGDYEREGLRCNALRAKVTLLPCVNN